MIQTFVCVRACVEACSVCACHNLLSAACTARRARDSATRHCLHAPILTHYWHYLFCNMGVLRKVCRRKVFLEGRESHEHNHGKNITTRIDCFKISHAQLDLYVNLGRSRIVCVDRLSRPRRQSPPQLSDFQSIVASAAAVHHPLSVPRTH